MLILRGVPEVNSCFVLGMLMQPKRMSQRTVMNILIFSLAPFYYFEMFDAESALSNLIGCFQPRGVLPYIGYTGICHWRGYGFQAIWSGKGYNGFQAIWSGIGSSNNRKLV